MPKTFDPRDPWYQEMMQAKAAKRDNSRVIPKCPQCGKIPELVSTKDYEGNVHFKLRCHGREVQKRVGEWWLNSTPRGRFTVENEIIVNLMNGLPPPIKPEKLAAIWTGGSRMGKTEAAKKSIIEWADSFIKDEADAWTPMPHVLLPKPKIIPAAPATPVTPPPAPKPAPAKPEEKPVVTTPSAPSFGYRVRKLLP